MKTAIRLIRKLSNGRFLDVKTKRNVTAKTVLAFHQTLKEEAIRVLDKKDNDITISVLIDALMELRHTDVELREVLSQFLDMRQAC